MISFAKWRHIKHRMRVLKILESDIEEKFIVGSGRGGQKVQKTSSCVFLKHLPTSMTIKCQQSRLRGDNRYHARVLLCDKFEEQILQVETKRLHEIMKIRRQKRRRSRRAKQKMLETKKQRGQLKKLRKPPKIDE